jgi:hypothetical protein
MDSKSLLQRTLRWAWTRDEVNPPTTRETLRYTVTMYVVTLGLIIVTGVVLSQLGYGTLSFSLLLFGIWFTTFIGVVNIGWEWMRYRYEVREAESPTEPSGPQRELAPDIRIDPDTKIGFIVTVAGILSLMVSFQVALYIIGSV